MDTINLDAAFQSLTDDGSPKGVGRLHNPVADEEIRAVLIETMTP